MKARGLSEADVNAALKTYMPTGKKDEYYHLRVGRPVGPGDRDRRPVDAHPQVHRRLHARALAGLRLRRQDSETVLDERRPPRPRRCAGATRTTRPSPRRTATTTASSCSSTTRPTRASRSSTSRTSRPSRSSRTRSSSRTTAAPSSRPNTDYVIEGSQYPAPLGGDYAPIEEYKEKYRGAIDASGSSTARRAASIPTESFAIELPPYTQDLADAGKLDSDGWAFINSFNTERAHGGNLEGKPPIESGASQNDMDYLHVINWKKAEELVKAGKAKTINGMPVIPLDDAAAEGVLSFVPEPKSPHGGDVTPGRQVHRRRRQARHARHGLRLREDQGADRGQEVRGQGPLRRPDPRLPEGDPAARSSSASARCTRVFDDKGNAYTSLFLESMVAKWSLRGPEADREAAGPLQHRPHRRGRGDTVKPDGKYVVAMNKWAIDRFADVGPLLPQNFQLIDIERRQDAAALRHADSARRAALRADDQGRQASSRSITTRRWHERRHRREGRRSRSRAARSASSAAATACTST